MINKSEFDLLLQEISEIEEKITELKVLNKFDKANAYGERLTNIRLKASSIVLDTTDSSNGFDELSTEIITELIKLNSEVDYYLLKVNNVIESAEVGEFVGVLVDLEEKIEITNRDKMEVYGKQESEQ